MTIHLTELILNYNDLYPRGSGVSFKQGCYYDLCISKSKIYIYHFHDKKQNHHRWVYPDHRYSDWLKPIELFICYFVNIGVYF